MSAALFHLATADAWAEAFMTGEYRGSTLEATLDEVGYIHLSSVDQVVRVADAFYRDREGVLLLVIDPERLDSEVRWEYAADAGEAYPHLYGPLPIHAVVQADILTLRADGTLDLTPHVSKSPPENSL